MRTRPRDHTYPTVIVLGVISCALAIAACGSSGKSTTVTRSHGAALAVRFSECMRSHGVSDFRDPTPNPAPATVHPLDKRSPAFQAAQRACQSVETEIADAKPRISRAVQVREAECMRAHGVPDYPDPLPGGGFDLPSTINPQSPAFIAAQSACDRP